MLSKLKEALTHPASAATAITGVLGGLLQVPLLSDLWIGLVAQSGSLFSAASIFAFTVAPEIDGVSAGLIKPIAIVLGVVFAGSKVWKALGNITERFSDD